MPIRIVALVILVIACDSPGDYYATPKPKSEIRDGVEYRPAEGTSEHKLMDGVLAARTLAPYCERRAKHPAAWRTYDVVEVEAADIDRYITLRFGTGSGRTVDFKTTRDVDVIVPASDPLACGYTEVGKTYEVTNLFGDGVGYWRCVVGDNLIPICYPTIGGCEGYRLEYGPKGMDILSCKAVPSYKIRCVSAVVDGADVLDCTTASECGHMRSELKRAKAKNVGKCEKPE